MRGGIHLLLLAAFVLQARCQQKPNVVMSPSLMEIFSGDLIYLTCNNSASGSKVTWYLNGEQKVAQLNKILKIPVADTVDSGTYHCESNGMKSDDFKVDVKENLPRATLTIKTGQPVMRPGESVVLQLDNDGGLQGWKCWVYRGHETRRIVLRVMDNPESLAFQTKGLNVQETIFWCTNDAQQHRSNQITVRTSEKHISLEMYPQPAVVGENLILKCYVWGTDQIRHVVFYKNEGEKNNWKIILESNSPTYKIPNVTASEKGQYKCRAIYTHVARTSGPPYNVTSDIQEVFVQAANVKAVISERLGLSCSCPRCPSDVSYRWYYKKNDVQSWTWAETNTGFMIPKESATYACLAVWNNGKSFLSNGYYYRPPITMFRIILIVLLVLLCLAVASAYILWKKRRNSSGPIYEDVGLRQRDKGDDKYEELQMTRGAQKEGEYDTLNPEAPGRESREGEYEPLREGAKEVYHTLGMQGAEGGAGAYEALKKEGMKDGVYHTLGKQGAEGGAGAYEALKKEGMKDEVYHTLGNEGAAGGGKEYEALNKEGMKEAVYHTLGVEEAAGGAREYEALKKEGMREGVYHTLGKEGAAGGEV